MRWWHKRRRQPHPSSIGAFGHASTIRPDKIEGQAQHFVRPMRALPAHRAAALFTSGRSSRRAHEIRVAFREARHQFTDAALELPLRPNLELARALT